jgi:hypothetical protein
MNDSAGGQGVNESGGRGCPPGLRVLVTGGVATAAYTAVSLVVSPHGGRPVSARDGAEPAPATATDRAVHWGYGVTQGLIAVRLHDRRTAIAASAQHLGLSLGPWWLARLARGEWPIRDAGKDLVKHAVFVTVSAVVARSLSGHAVTAWPRSRGCRTSRRG